MSTSYQVKSTTHIDEATTKSQDRSIFVLQLHSGQIVVGSAANPCKRIAAINSGLSPEVAKPLQVTVFSELNRWQQIGKSIRSSVILSSSTAKERDAVW